jgi:hypothetical protein
MTRPHAHPTRSPTARWFLPMLLLAPGCLFGGDNSPPKLIVDFYWQPEHHADDTCEGARVATMEWQLVDERGNVVKAENRDCENGFVFPDLAPGYYSIKVVGHDEAMTKTWQGKCGLTLDRFDCGPYQCDIGLVTPPDRDGGTDDVDAGE